MLSAPLMDLSSPAVSAAMEENLFIYLSTLQASPRIQVQFGVNLCWSISDLPFFLYNSLWRTRLTGANAEAAILAAKARGQARGVALGWWLGPSASPSDLGERLERHGFSGEQLPGMAADLAHLNQDVPGPPGLRVEGVHDLPTLRTWCETFIPGYGLPAGEIDTCYGWLANLGLGEDVPLRHFLARLDGRPVAASTLCLAGGVAGIYAVATLAEVRGKGIGAAVTLAPLLSARSMGYRAGVLQSSAMGYPVYRRLGFRDHCPMGLYIWQPPPDLPAHV